MSSARVLVALALLWSAPALAGDALELELLASGFKKSLGLVNAGDGSQRLFVVERAGRIRVIDDGVARRRPFLDITDRVSCCQGGRGLLGLAFHPEYDANGFFFVHYSDLDGNSVVARFSVSDSDPDRARASSELSMLTFEQTVPGHAGGDLAFGPDGFLYVASGDGSPGNDPDDNAQNLGLLLGKILRLDVDAGPSAVPADNPFLDTPGARDEIWAYGLRNPWRISFDRSTGDLFIADVGQNRIEEVNFQAAANRGGENYGWRLMEGSACFEPATDCDPGDLVAPILEYDHDVGCAVTGGYRYRGRRAPTLAGHYLFGDYCSGTVWGAEPNRDGVWVARVLARTDVRIVSFGEDERGELYIVEFGGDVHRLVSREIFASGFESGRFTGWKRKGAAEIVTPGLVGSGFALAVPASGGAGAYVRTRASRRLPELEIAFHLNTGELELVGGATDVLALADGRGVHLRVTLEQLSPKRGRATLWVADGQGVERRVGRVRLKAGATDELTVAWRSASHASAGDGFASLAKNGSVRASAADLATGARFANALELGLPSGAPAGSLGWLLIDRVSLRR